MIDNREEAARELRFNNRVSFGVNEEKKAIAKNMFKKIIDIETISVKKFTPKIPLFIRGFNKHK